MIEPTELDQKEPENLEPNDEIVWEDPPNIGYGRTRVWEPRLWQVMVQPGKWARVLECKGIRAAEGHVGNLRGGKIMLPPGRWEFASRSDKEKNVSRVYAKYLGPEEQDVVDEGE